ncbi:MAG: GntR family transcriptional regulator [Thermodesulfobacteriota bacterium]
MLPEAVEKVYEKIKSEILNNTYLPGQPLTEIPLSEKYGIKRARVRQVIRKLEGDSLVTKIPGKGAFVKTITPRDFQAIFELREALEGMAARLAARRRKDGELEKIVQLFEKNVRLSKAESVQYKKKIGQKLHDFILQSCENDLIIKAIEPLKMQILRIWHDSSTFTTERVSNSFKEHKEIIKALKCKDESQAEAKMKEHIAIAFKEYLNSIYNK